MIRLLNYLPKYRDGSWLDNGIDWWSRAWNLKAPKILRCSHSEIWTPAEDGLFSHITAEGVKAWSGKCWTSTLRGEVDGVCVRDAYEVVKYDFRWTYFDIHVDGDIYPRLIQRMHHDVDNNKGYGKIKIASFFTPWRFGTKPICSEQCCRWLTEGANSMTLMYRLMKLQAPSPLRLAYNVHMAGIDLHDMTGRVILKGAK